MAPKTGRKRSAAQADEESTSKKTRFVEPTDDPANFAEQVDSALEEPSRRGKIKTEGYDSDSTDDGEGVVESRKKSGNDEEDDLDDMFTSGDKEDKEQTKGKDKEEKFLRLADIEGQEFGNESHSEHESDDEDEPEDEDDLERKKKAGMGYELSSFNMRDEMEEGKFTEDGMYVRSFDPHGVHDRWMEGLNEKEIKQARRRKREQEKKQKERVLAEEKELEESGGKPALEQSLIAHLKKGETVIEALARLGNNKKRQKPLKKSKPGTSAMDVDKASTQEPTEIEVITDLASRIMSLGDTDIYSKTFEEIVRSVRSSGRVPSSWEPTSADVKYEYKWRTTEAGSTDETFGPFGEEEIKSWFKASYFGPQGEKIQVRKVGGDWSDWDDVVV